jgi:hypothetical protein
VQANKRWVQSQVKVQVRTWVQREVDFQVDLLQVGHLQRAAHHHLLQVDLHYHLHHKIA